MTSLEIKAAIVLNGWEELAPVEIAALLNIPKTVLVETQIGFGMIMNTLGTAEGAALLDQMEALALENSTVKWGMRLLANAQLDVGLASTRAMLDALLPAPYATALKALAERTVSAGVTTQQVIDAMEDI